MPDAIDDASAYDLRDSSGHGRNFWCSGDHFDFGREDNPIVGDTGIEVCSAVAGLEIRDTVKSGDDVLDFVDAVLGGREKGAFAVCAQRLSAIFCMTENA